MYRNEAQTRFELIDPAIERRGWSRDLIKVEKTPGGVDILPDGTTRKRRGRSDYLLCLPSSPGLLPLPVAIIEAKKEDSSPSRGLQQAQDYARKFNVPFAFSSNGVLFTEYAEDTNLISEPRSLEHFPTPDELRRRYESFRKIQIDSAAARALFIQYKSGEATRFYYQDAAIRAAIEKMAMPGRAGKRVLLSLATGTGKTFIAKELLWKLAESGLLRRALFLVDRDELRTQALTHLQGYFGDDAQEVTTSHPATNAKILIATYQTLNVGYSDRESRRLENAEAALPESQKTPREPRFWKENFPPGFFSHIIIDECHRSAWNEWSVVLTDNPDAVHIGLTATPRIIIGPDGEPVESGDDQAITAHNLQYFGEPAYEYSILDGQEDGYLAASEIIRRFVDLDAQVLTRDMIRERSAYYVATGQRAEVHDIDEAYIYNRYERGLLLADRISAMCEDFFDFLLQTGGPYQKTIIFCVSELHSEEVCIKIQNLYNQWCLDNRQIPREPYAVKITAESGKAKSLIAELRESRNSHFLATTVELLSTGVDVPNLNNVVFFKYISSPIVFYQMVGRGTRIGEPRGSKMMFRIYDYTNATRLFGKDFTSRITPSQAEGNHGDTEGTSSRALKVGDYQFEVTIEDRGRAILVPGDDGKEILLPYEEYVGRLSAALSTELPNLDHLRAVWVNPEKRRDLLERLPGGEGALYLVRELEDARECDLYDIAAMLAFRAEPKTRAERAAGFRLRNRDWLNTLPPQTREALVTMAGQFGQNGIEAFETEAIFDVPGVDYHALAGLPWEPTVLIHHTKLRLLA